MLFSQKCVRRPMCCDKVSPFKINNHLCVCVYMLLTHCGLSAGLCLRCCNSSVSPSEHATSCFKQTTTYLHHAPDNAAKKSFKFIVTLKRIIFWTIVVSVASPQKLFGLSQTDKRAAGLRPTDINHGSVSERRA